MLLYLFFYIPLVCFSTGDNEKYTTKYDNIDIDAIIANERLLLKYVQCLLDLVACTVEGLELKGNMPDAIETDCSKCSQKQKEASEKFILYLIDNKPEYWQQLQNKYDQTGDYTKRFLESKKGTTEEITNVTVEDD